MKCDTTVCEGETAFRYTWPGRNEMRVCLLCAVRALNVAEGMGFDLEVIPLSPEALAEIRPSQP
jgi:hypothetical protein